jgi:Sugar kinases, ribokinase family
MKNLKMLTIGGATQDIYLHYQGADCMKIFERGGERNYMLFASGAKVEVEKVLYYTGGGATNSAVSLKRLGFDVSCICRVGDDHAGHAIVQDLQHEGVNTGNVIVSKEPSGTSFIVNSLQRDRSIFAYRGANSFLAEKDIPLGAIEHADLLYITSLSNEAAKVLQKIVMHAKTCKRPVAINPGGSQLSTGAQSLKESLKYIDILILNNLEAHLFMGALVDEQSNNEDLYFSIDHFFKAVKGLGPSIIAVTHGSEGVYVFKENKVFFHPSLPVEVVNTVGAGDAFGSCFVGCLQLGMSIEDALRGGIVNSASVIGKIGAKSGLLTYAELCKQVRGIDKGLLRTYEL